MPRLWQCSMWNKIGVSIRNGAKAVEGRAKGRPTLHHEAAEDGEGHKDHGDDRQCHGEGVRAGGRPVVRTGAGLFSNTGRGSGRDTLKGGRGFRRNKKRDRKISAENRGQKNPTGSTPPPRSWVQTVGGDQERRGMDPLLGLFCVYPIRTVPSPPLAPFLSGIRNTVP